MRACLRGVPPGAGGRAARPAVPERGVPPGAEEGR